MERKKTRIKKGETKGKWKDENNNIRIIKICKISVFRGMGKDEMTREMSWRRTGDQ